jgi:RNase P/RNase MRP subunit p29
VTKGSLEAVITNKFTNSKPIQLDNIKRPRGAKEAESAGSKKKRWTPRRLRGMTNAEHLQASGLDYAMASELHLLWQEYIRSSVFYDNPIPTVAAARLYRADFHGAKIAVVAATNPVLIGLHGLVLQDWQHIFRIITPTGTIKSIPKQGTTLEISWSEQLTFHLYGSQFCAKPSQRCKR